MNKYTSRRSAFTIVELLVVIVVIGILAAITIVSYSGIASRAEVAALQSDLKNATTQLEIDKTLNNDTYPSTKEAANNGLGLKFSPGMILDYTYNDGDNSYCLSATNTKGVSYHVTSNDRNPVVGLCSVASSTYAYAWGGSADDYGYTLTSTSDGGYIITGATESYTAGFSDMFLAKYAANGSLTWTKTWGGIEYDSGTSVIQTSDGGYAVAGGADSFSGNGSRDSFLAKYAANGDLIWDRVWGGDGDDSARTVIQADDGGYIVSGETNSFSSEGDYDFFLVKYDSGGTFSWNKTWGTINDELNINLAKSSDGSYAVVSSGRNPGDDRNNEIILSEFDSNGNISWSKGWGGPESDKYSFFAASDDGGYVLGGVTNSFSTGDDDMFLVKFAGDGTFSWNKTWGDVSEEYGGSVIQADDGGYVMTGTTNVDSLGFDYYDMFLLKVTSTGDFSWSKSWGTGDETGDALIQTNDGGYAVIGSTWVSDPENADMFIAKFDSNGSMSNCPVNVCKDSISSLGTPTASLFDVTLIMINPSATMPDPVASTDSPTAATRTIVAPN